MPAGRKSEFTTAQMAEITAKYEAGETPTKLAKAYKCSRNQIYRMVQKIKEVEPVTTELDLNIQNAHDRALYEWMKVYAKEVGCSVRQLMRLLIIKEKQRAERGQDADRRVTIP